MNKDAILATLIGFAIGLVITGILLVGPTIVKDLPHVTLPAISLGPKGAPSPTPTPQPKAFSVTIESPLAEAIENDDAILVSGATEPGATVVVAGPIDETVVVVNGDGKYAGKIKLMEGKNDITVTSYGKDKQTSQTVTVYYTQEQL